MLKFVTLLNSAELFAPTTCSSSKSFMFWTRFTGPSLGTPSRASTIWFEGCPAIRNVETAALRLHSGKAHHEPLREKANTIRTVAKFLRGKSCCHLAAFRLNDGGVRRYLDCASHFPELKCEIEAARFASRQQKVIGDELLETWAGSRQTIGSSGKVRNFVFSTTSGHRLAAETGAHIRNLDLCGWNGGGAWIDSYPADRSEIGLRA